MGGDGGGASPCGGCRDPMKRLGGSSVEKVFIVLEHACERTSAFGMAFGVADTVNGVDAVQNTV